MTFVILILCIATQCLYGLSLYNNIHNTDTSYYTIKFSCKMCMAKRKRQNDMKISRNTTKICNSKSYFWGREIFYCKYTKKHPKIQTITIYNIKS